MLRTSFIRRGSIFALAAALAITSGALVGCSGGNNDSAEEQQGTFAASELPLDEMQAAFEGDSIVKNGVASDAYLNPSPYKVTSFEVTNNRDSDDGTEYEIKATIENDNYVTEMTVDGLQQDSRYEFDVVDSTTTPKKGIDNDSEYGIENANAALLEDGNTCEVEAIDTYGYWFVDVTNGGTYTYKFNGKMWELDSDDAIEKVEYKDMDGTYTAPAGEMETWSNFKVSNLDSKTGAFHISFTQEEFANEFGNDMVKVNVDLNAGMKPVSGATSSGAMDDGVLYAFEAHGTTDKGDGNASMEGYVGVDKAGNEILYINHCSVDTEFFNGITKEMSPKSIGISDWTMLKD